VDPLNYFNMYPGRFELWHVKDMKNTPDKGFTEVGTGIIPYKEYFQYQGLAGMKYFFVEQDDCEMDPLESAAISFENLDQIVAK
jgi:sugar phosphate isomerase/epimerase